MVNSYYSSRPVHKTNTHILAGLVVLVILFLGAVGGLVLARTNSDNRNQAAGNGQCNPGQLLGCEAKVQCGPRLGKYCTEAHVPGGCVPIRDMSQCNVTTGGGGTIPTPTPTPAPTLPPGTCVPGKFLGCANQVQCATGEARFCSDTGVAGPCVRSTTCNIGSGGPTPSPSPYLWPTPTPSPSSVPTPTPSPYRACTPGAVLGCGSSVGCPNNSGALASARICSKNGVPGTCENIDRSRCPEAQSGDYNRY